jgi:extracellular factor (EF) 3-hydroxypalmitic acid methyl ester biosynthesis protein
MRELRKEGFMIMDNSENYLMQGNFRKGIDSLVTGLNEFRQKTDPESWQQFCNTEFKQHPLIELVHQCPFTYHSFVKPRNYSGDAELVDFMYRVCLPDSETTEVGKGIFDVTINAPAPQSVRERRTIIASMIDELSQDIDDLRILSIACGHLREASISTAVMNGKVKEFFALDQDALSLEVVKSELSQYNVKPIHAPIKSLFTNGHEFRDLDFVYSAGLYDYLPQSVAIKLTARMFGMLKSGGKLLVANFAPCLRDIGYMETFMQWKLIYRNEAQVEDFAGLIPNNEIAGQRRFWDQAGNVIYLEIVRN